MFSPFFTWLYIKIYYKAKGGNIELRAISELTGKIYEAEDVVWYGNMTQVGQYYLWGCKPIDITANPETRRLSFAFNKKDHKRFIDKWNAQRKQYQQDTEL